MRCAIIERSYGTLLTPLCLFVIAMAVEFISTNAAGSGIPEMKSIMSGVVVSRYLSTRTVNAPNSIL
jgi:H+/Cl- antiporter ClcA